MRDKHALEKPMKDNANVGEYLDFLFELATVKDGMPIYIVKKSNCRKLDCS